MTEFLSRLQVLAENLEIYIVLIHHVGHGARDEARSAGRGASAIGAVAQCLWLISNLSESPRLRRLHVQGNEVLESTTDFRVSSDESEPGAILFWRPTNQLDGYVVEDLISPGEEISTSALAWRLQGDEPAEGQRPANQYQRTAKALREHWERARVVEVFDGQRGSKMLRLRTPQ
jgi:hypothetical protein